MIRAVLSSAVMVVLATMSVACDGGGDTPESFWSTSMHGTILEASWGTVADSPQVVALHTESGYLRLVPGRGFGWGTSVVLAPSYWTGGRYLQGVPVEARPEVVDGNLRITVSGSVEVLFFTGTVLIHPPAEGRIRAEVSMTTEGDVTLDARPGEAFKPLMLSSMRVSDTQWDTSATYVGAQPFAIPADGWIAPAPVSGRTFGLKGGTSDWKTNAPTIEIALPEAMPVTGWVTRSEDPNDDNVAFWPASDTVLREWHYTITAKGS